MNRKQKKKCFFNWLVNLQENYPKIINSLKMKSMKNKNNSILLDTNLWIYFYCKTDENKHNLVSNLIDKNFDYIIIIISQILGELYHVLTRYLANKNLKQLL